MNDDEERRLIEASGLLGSLELRVMGDLWAHEPSTVNQVLERLNAQSRRPLAYNSVMTVMARLAEKGHLQRSKAGRAFVYTPAADRAEFLRRSAASAAAEVVEDFGELAVAGFVDTVQTDPQLLQTLRRLMGSRGDGVGDEGEGEPR